MSPSKRDPNSIPTSAEVECWLIERVAQRLGLQVDRVRADAALTELGLDSLEAVLLHADLEKWLSVQMPETLFWEHPTIQDLAAAVVTERNKAGDDNCHHA